MKVMISQPMRNKTNDEIKKERENLVKKIELEGDTVIDTIFAKDTPQGIHEPIYYLGKSIIAMSEADAVIFMKGWEKARGCKIEYEIAKEYGLYIKKDLDYSDKTIDKK